ncbi:MAG: nuclease-like protein [Pseudomonadota bacterium]
MRTIPYLRHLIYALFLAVWLGLGVNPAYAANLNGFAQVRDDGSLSIQGRVIRLKGIFIPIDERTCRTFIVPARCAAEAVLVLDGLVDGFVHCRANVRYFRNGTRAFCSIEGDSILDERQDLGALMIRQGFALASEDAPPQYRALEKLARAQERGLWNPGFVNLR